MTPGVACLIVRWWRHFAFLIRLVPVGSALALPSVAGGAVLLINLTALGHFGRHAVTVRWCAPAITMAGATSKTSGNDHLFIKRHPFARGVPRQQITVFGTYHETFRR